MLLYLWVCIRMARILESWEKPGVFWIALMMLAIGTGGRPMLARPLIHITFQTRNAASRTRHILSRNAQGQLERKCNPLHRMAIFVTWCCLWPDADYDLVSIRSSFYWKTVSVSCVCQLSKWSTIKTTPKPPCPDKQPQNLYFIIQCSTLSSAFILSA